MLFDVCFWRGFYAWVFVVICEGFFGVVLWMADGFAFDFGVVLRLFLVLGGFYGFVDVCFDNCSG